ncbi:hypothetical protein LCGC14_1353850 [marine sediment metagenome]|uniref:Uncharacterized protein n=1 Tax=marine sediment metagenome TaxID=412755 RepID=A0A0F9NCC5_9ZZZZ
MTDQISRVARAIDHAPFGRQDLNWNGEESPLWEHYHRTDVTRIASAKNRARDVLKAMRVPSPKMVNAMIAAHRNPAVGKLSNRRKHRIRYMAAIDKAFEE